jgi:hypothetical protein
MKYPWELRPGRWQDSPPEMVDHIISDPPYTDLVSARARTRKGLAWRQGRDIETSETHLSFDGIDPGDIAGPLLERCRRWAVFFCAIEQVGAYSEAEPHAWVRGGWWSKSNRTPQFTGDRPGVPGESLAILHGPTRKRWNRGGHAAEWIGPNVHDRNGAGDPWDERVHETQKPLWLMVALVEAFTDPGDLVWDPYCGSGTTGVACLLLGRRFLGHEEQPRYVEAGRRRLRAAEAGQPLRDHEAGQLTLLGGADAPHPWR